MSKNQTASNGILSVTIRDRAVLYAAYMPFLSGGGLFVPTKKSYQLGDDVFLLISLLGEPEKTPISGKVAWITPIGAQGGRIAGIGVQFGSQEREARVKFENYMAGLIHLQRNTHTL